MFAGPIVAADIAGVLGQPAVADIVRRLARRSLVHVDRSAPRHASIYSRRSARSPVNDSPRPVGPTRSRDATQNGSSTSLAAPTPSCAPPGGGRTGSSRVHFRRAARRTDWASDHDLDLAADLSAHLHIYAQARFIDEPLVWAEQLLELVAVDHPQRPVLLASAATRAIRRGDIADARRLAHEAVAARRRHRGHALPALDALTDAGLFDGLLEHSFATARTMEQLARRYDDRHYHAIAYSGQALSAAYGGDPDSDAETKLADLDRAGAVAVRPGLGRVHPRRTLPRTRLATGSRPLRRRRARRPQRPQSLHRRSRDRLGLLATSARRRPLAALDAFAEAIHHWIGLASTAQQLTTLRNLAVLFQRLDAPEPLAELLGAVDHGDIPTYGEEADRLHDARIWASTTLGRCALR